MVMKPTVATSGEAEPPIRWYGLVFIKLQCRIASFGMVLVTLVQLVALALIVSFEPAFAAGTASDGPGDHASWTTGNKMTVGTSADQSSKVWFTVAKGITGEIFYPRLDVPNMQDMQYIVTDGSSFVDLERDATTHAVSMPDEKALEYTITNTDKRTTPKYRITNTYITDPDRNTLLIRTRFQSLDGNSYQLYLLENPSMAGGGMDDNAWWDGTNAALMSSGTDTLFGSKTTIVSALKVASPNGFVAHENGYAGAASDCLVELRTKKVLTSQFDNVASNGNVVQCGELGNIGTDTTFTVALGYGSDARSALAAADASLAAGFSDREDAYRGIPPRSGGWNGYVNSLRAAPSSVSSDTLRRRVYYVAAMTLHAAEDKTFSGASVAGFGTPWGDFTNGDTLNAGYHRVWGRDLYQQATGLIAAGDTGQASRMAKFMWDTQFISVNTPGKGTSYSPGSFPRFSPVSGISGATPEQLDCCEQLDQEAFAILLAWMTGLTDRTTYAKVKMTADHIQAIGPNTTERWEERQGLSPSSTAAEIAGLVAAADIARQNGDNTSATSWNSTADSWRSSLPAWTFTTDGFWDGHRYYERIDPTKDPNDNQQIGFPDGSFFAHDVVDFGFLDLVRLGVQMPAESNVATSIDPTAAGSDGNGKIQVKIANGDIYFHRYNHDNYGESNTDCSGWVANRVSQFGRLWPVLSGERGEYELANGRSATLYLQSMADAANDGFFIPEQIWDRSDITCFALGRPTGSASPLNWSEGQYLRLAQSIDAGYNLDTPSVVKMKYRGAGSILSSSGKCIDDAGASTNNGTAIQIWTCNATNAQSWMWNSSDGTLRVFGKCMDVTGGGTAIGTQIQLWDCNGTGAQQWRWREQTRIVNPQSGRCLDVTGNGITDGTRLQLWDCNDTAAQAWHLS
ncbi:MAG: RICIN domain-containing protein [Deltaproteobacteria bacterium]|nr:RICIN domain-containing protein [Deltaproteobacteria bacterium]